MAPPLAVTVWLYAAPTVAAPSDVGVKLMVGAEVVSGATFERWYREASRDNPKLLMLSREELMRHEAAGVTSSAFPRTVRLVEVGPRDGLQNEPRSVPIATRAALIDRLAENGLIERKPDPNDRRANRLFLTPAAKPLLERLNTIGNTVMETVLAGLDQKTVERMVQDLGKMRANLRNAIGNLGAPAVVIEKKGAAAVATGGSLDLGADASGAERYPLLGYAPALPPESLGDPDFRRDHGLRLAYVAGAMANGGEPLLLLPPEIANSFQRNDCSKAEAKKLIWERATLPNERLSSAIRKHHAELRVAAGVGPRQPAVLFHTSSYWAQGLNFGLLYRW